MTETLTFVDLQDTGNAQSQMVMVAIARHANWDTGIAVVSTRELARMAKCSLKTCRRHLKRLKGDGFVTIEERAREDGSQGANTITLAGYAEWIAGNRKGGSVPRPKKGRRYADQDLGVDADPLLGQDDQGGGGDNVTRGVVNPTTGPGHLLTRGPGQQVTIPKEPSTEPSTEHSPPAPRRGRGERGGEDIDELIGQVASPARQRALDRLLRPAISQRVFKAPHRSYALGILADWIKDDPDHVLAKALELVLADRVRTIEPSDIEKAVRTARAKAKFAVDRYRTPASFEAWLAYYRATGNATRVHILEKYDHSLEDTEMPPPLSKGRAA